MTAIGVFRLYKAMEQDFIGDHALFWAGKMANIIATLSTTYVSELNEKITLLRMCADEYDKIIFSRMEKKQT